jgi:hypothetical protein
MAVKQDWGDGDVVGPADLNALAAQANSVSFARFSSPVAMIGVSPSDRAYSSRTFSSARMRVSSAPVGSDLTVQVQHWNGFTWITQGTLQIANGSVVESVVSLSFSQAAGDMVRLNCTSVGSTSAATGVVVDVLI